MILTEIFEPAVPGYQDPEQDNSVTKITDVRKTRLTLAQLNSLRKMADVRRVEKEQKLGEIQRQYGVKAQASM